MRKFAAAGLGAALLGAGLTASLGAGVAVAAPGCEASAVVVKQPLIALGPLKHTYTYQKTATAEVIPGGKINYSTTISTAEGLPLVYNVTDLPPAGFGAPVEAYVSPKHILGEKVGDRKKVDVIPSGNGYRVSNALGWMLTSGENLLVEFIYQVPASLNTGDEIRSNGVKVDGTLKIGAEIGSELATCAKVRPLEPGEAIGGSLDGAGLGSMNTASANAFGSLLDPSGSVNGILKDLPLGDMIGNLS